MSSTRGSICPLLVPELLSLIITELQTTRLSRTANMATVLELSRVSKALSERVLPLLYKSPPFALRHMDVVQSLLANPSPYLPYLSFIRYLDMAPLARPPMNDPSPAAAWIANTKLAHQLVASCPFLLTVRMDGFPPDVTGTLFANMLLSIPVSVEHIFWDRVAVSDGHLAKMVGRWPNLKTLQIGIVTPFMWGVRNMVAGPPPSQPFQILTLNGIGGAAAASNYGGPDWASPGNSIGLLTLVATSTHLQHMIIQPLPGDDGTTHLLQVLSDSAPLSLRSLTLGRGRYLAASKFSAVRLWRHVLLFLARTRVNRLSIADPYSSCHRFCLAVWCLGDEFLERVSMRLRMHRRHDASVVVPESEVVALVKSALRRWVLGKESLEKLARGDVRQEGADGQDEPVGDFRAMNEVMANFQMISPQSNLQQQVVRTGEGGSNPVALELRSGILVHSFGEMVPLVFGKNGISIFRGLVEEFGEPGLVNLFVS